MGRPLIPKRQEISTFDSQGIRRDASSMNSSGESPILPAFSSNNDIHNASVSIVDNGSVSHCPSLEEIIAFGGIPKPSGNVRSSTRLGGQPNADMPQMEKAMMKAQSRDDSFSSGQCTIPMHSIINIPNSEIAKRADRLGISLGNSPDEIGKSIKGLKMVEEERILTILENKNSEMEDMEEGLETLVLSKVSTLCEDLIDDDDTLLDMDDQLEHLKPVVKVKKLDKGKSMILVISVRVLGKELKNNFHNAESKRY
jgi:hypothetical protein